MYYIDIYKDTPFPLDLRGRVGDRVKVIRGKVGIRVHAAGSGGEYVRTERDYFLAAFGRDPL